MRSVYFYGGGKAGMNLAHYFSEKGIKVTGVYRRKPPAGKGPALEIPRNDALNIRSFVDKNDIASADIVFITTVDSAIAESFRKLAGAGLLAENQVICHCSGAITSDVFMEGSARRGGRGAMKFKKASLHPAQSFTRIPLDMRSLELTAFVAEGDSGAISALKDLMKDLPNPFYTIDKSLKPVYHAACTLANNYTVVLHILASGLLERAGFSKKDGVRILAPMLAELSAGAFNAETFTGLLTGPVRRGDEETVKKQLKAVKLAAPGIYPLFAILTGKCREIVRKM